MKYRPAFMLIYIFFIDGTVSKKPRCFVCNFKSIYLLVILLEEEMVGKMVQHHRVLRVDAVGLAQLLHTVPGLHKRIVFIQVFMSFVALCLANLS